MASAVTGPPAQGSAMAMTGFWLGLIALVILAIDGPGYRMHWWGLWPALRLLIPGAMFLGTISVIVSLIGLGISRNKGIAVAGLILGLIAASIPAKNIYTAKHSPIHDVSTDTNNPPQFVAVLPLRQQAKAVNSTNYDAKTAELQRKTYPDIAPLELKAAPQQAFDRALSAARKMGWQIDSSDPAQGRIEATATTFWFGFKDDIVVRITPQDNGSRLDVRSESRIGKSDVGMNARRVRNFLAKIKNS